MYAVGHLALGYLAGRAASKLFNVEMNIPMLFVASIIPDIDLLVPYFEDRGLIHSIFIFGLLFLPASLLYGKRAVPYFAALATHSIIGDYLTNDGVQLLWPVTLDWYGGGIPVRSLTNALLEWILFIISLTIMLRTKDLEILFQKHSSNILLSIPALTILLPTIFNIPTYVPAALFFPHFTCLSLFTLSILIDFVPDKKIKKEPRRKRKTEA